MWIQKSVVERRPALIMFNSFVFVLSLLKVAKQLIHKDAENNPFKTQINKNPVISGVLKCCPLNDNFAIEDNIRFSHFTSWVDAHKFKQTFIT